MIGGVCSGLGRYFGIDPVVLRVGFVVGIFAGGLGLLVYLAMWLLIPDDTDTSRNPLTNSLWRLVLGVLVGLGGTAALFGWLRSLGGFGGVIVGGSIVGLGLWMYSRDKGGFASPRSPTPATPPATGFAYGGTGEPAANYQSYGPAMGTSPTGEQMASSQSDDAASFAYATEGSSTGYQPYDPATGTYPTTEQSASFPYDGPVATTYPTERLAAGYTYYDPATGSYLTTEPKPRRQHSYLGLITLLVMLVVAGLLGVAQVAGLVSFSAVVFLSILLAVISVGLIVGAFVGRARWLIAPGLLLALTIGGLAPVAPFISATVDAGFGERIWQPMTADLDYDLGLGSATLDLTEWATNPNAADPQIPDNISAEVGVGQLTVLVPETWAVVVDAELQFGELVLNGVPVADAEIDIEYNKVLPAKGDASGRIGLNLAVEAGQITISQVAVPRVPKRTEGDSEATAIDQKSAPSSSNGAVSGDGESPQRVPSDARRTNRSDQNSN